MTQVNSQKKHSLGSDYVPFKPIKFEVYLLKLILCLNFATDNVVIHSFSRVDSMEFVKKEMQQIFHISLEDEVLIWKRYMNNSNDRQ